MFAAVALLLVAALLFLLLGQNRRTRNFPPGPRTFPIFGNLLDLNLEDPLPDLDRLRKRYGNVYSFFLGPRPAIVINGVQAFKEALVNKADAFSGRPQDQIFNHIVQMTADAPGVILSDYNSGWRDHRRFGLRSLKNLGLGKESMEQRILMETQHVIKTLKQSDGKPINPHLLFHKATSNVICQVLFGKRFDYNDESIKLFVNFFHETSTIINGRWGLIYDSIALVRHLPLPFQRAFRSFKSVRGRHLEIFIETKKSRVPGKPRHFVDCYLDELDKRGDDGSSFSEDQLCAFVLDLHFAGTDTTANTLLFAFLYLTNHPHVQDILDVGESHSEGKTWKERCQQEIDKVLDGKDQASFEERHQLPYVQAVLHEIQRVANIGPLGLFHMVTKDSELMGYSIPKGTMLIPNLSSVLSEEGQWKYPHEFNPENFLTERGEFVKPEAFIPFSVGPRVCLGENLARMELFLIMVTLLRRFRFVWPEDAGEPDFTHIFGSIQHPKPYCMKVQVRKDLEKEIL